jgi:hypothetical protein
MGAQGVHSLEQAQSEPWCLVSLAALKIHRSASVMLPLQLQLRQLHTACN